MSRIAGVLFLLAILYGGLYWSDPVNAFGKSNLVDVANRQGLFCVLTIGAGLLIVAGGIDLSIGSVVGLSAVLFGVLMQDGLEISVTWDGQERQLIDTGPVRPLIALPITIAVGTVIGLIHGLLVTRLHLQSFLVTLCGLFVYRGLARSLTRFPVGVEKVKASHPEFRDELTGLQYWLSGLDSTGELIFPAQLVIALVIAIVVGLFLHQSAYGRYWYAIGHNEQAARYAGVNVERSRLAVFIICSTLASFGGCLLLLAYGTAMPENAGETYELYAITGAVLGGCSLRGGEGTAAGMFFGGAVLPLLRNLVIFLGIRDAIVPAIIGLTLLSGVILEEQIRRGTGKKLLSRLFGKSSTG